MEALFGKFRDSLEQLPEKKLPGVQPSERLAPRVVMGPFETPRTSRQFGTEGFKEWVGRSSCWDMRELYKYWFIFWVSKECIGIVVFCIRDYISRICSILMEFLETSDCTDESRKDETCLKFLRWRSIILKLEKCLDNISDTSLPKASIGRA